jgi:hypothetical protein
MTSPWNTSPQASVIKNYQAQKDRGGAEKNPLSRFEIFLYGTKTTRLVSVLPPAILI